MRGEVVKKSVENVVGEEGEFGHVAIGRDGY